MSIDKVYGSLSMEAADLLMQHRLSIAGNESAETDIRRAKNLLSESSGWMDAILVKAQEGFDVDEELNDAGRRCTILEKYIIARDADMIPENL